MGSASPKCRPQKIPPCSLFCGRACRWAVLVEIKDLKDLKRVPPKCRASRRNAAPPFLRATVKSRENKCRCHVGSPSGLQVWGIQPRSVSFFNTATPPPSPPPPPLPLPPSFYLSLQKNHARVLEEVIYSKPQRVAVTTFRNHCL